MTITCCFCGGPTATRVKGPHIEEYCDECGRHQRFVKKSELGLATRSVSRSKIKPKQRSRIIDRARGRCERCGVPAAKTKAGLHVGHVVSEAEGRRVGVAQEVIDSDENLIAECDECNLGHGKAPIPMSVFIAILMTRVPPCT